MTELTVFCDYTCPYVYRATEWVYTIQDELSPPPTVAWRFFSLTQVNYRQRDGWKVWDEPQSNDDWTSQDYARGLRLFWAAEASRRQGDEAFARLHRALLSAIHADKQRLDSLESIQEVADSAGLDNQQFARDMQDVSCLERLQQDHTAGEKLQIFGTPTFVFPNVQPAYLKLTKPLYETEAAEFWQSFQSVVADKPYVMEIKRPQ